MRAADCKPYRSFYELLTGKKLPWPKAASVVGLFHNRMSPMAHRVISLRCGTWSLWGA